MAGTFYAFFTQSGTTGDALTPGTGTEYYLQQNTPRSSKNGTIAFQLSGACFVIDGNPAVDFAHLPVGFTLGGDLTFYHNTQNLQPYDPAHDDGSIGVVSQAATTGGAVAESAQFGTFGPFAISVTGGAAGAVAYGPSNTNITAAAVADLQGTLTITLTLTAGSFFNGNGQETLVNTFIGVRGSYTDATVFASQLVAEVLIASSLLPRAAPSSAYASLFTGNPNAVVVPGALAPNSPTVPLSLLGLVVPNDGWSTTDGGEDGTGGSAVSGPSSTNANVGGCLAFGDFILALAARLKDPTYVHWTQAELQRYIIEALRTYQACSQSLRNRGVFLTSTSEPFYDLPTVLPSLRGYNVNDTDLILDLEYALMEPPSTSTWLGTVQFTMADLVAAIQRRRDLFLRETGAVLTREVRSVTPPMTGRLTFPNDVITIRRAAWISAANVVIPLQRDDEWGMNQYLPTWPSLSVDPAQTWPTAFSIGVTPPLTVQVAPPITNPGSLDLLSVLLGATLGVSLPTSTLLGMPDDWTWVVKFGALSDLLSLQGVAFDPDRAAYCEARWQHGIKLATAATVVLAAQINGGVVPITSLSESDKYDPTWQTTLGTPKRVLIDAQNLVGLSPPPSGNATVVQLDLVVNFPIPVNLADCVDVDKSIMEIVIDYAEALAMFKEGPGLVQQSMALIDKFLRACGVTIELDTASVPTRAALFQQTVQDQRIVSRRSPPESQEPSA